MFTAKRLIRIPDVAKKNFNELIRILISTNLSAANTIYDVLVMCIKVGQW